MKCQICPKEASSKNFVKVENNFVYFCSSTCLWNYLKERFQEEGRVFAGIISEE
jgi:ribosome-binding protein aMBF1 (putative translation factor)